MKGNQTALAVLVVLWVGGAAVGGHREKGYLYLSPVPSAEYVQPETRFVLVRFEGVSPYSLTNLSSFISVAGASSGVHSGETRIASDDRTVIFEMSAGFSGCEPVTVSLAPTFEGVTVAPYEYQFMVGGPMPGGEPAFGEAWDKSLVAGTVVETRSAESEGIAESASKSLAAGTKGLGGARIMANGVSVPSDFPQAVVTVNDNPAPGYIFIDYDGAGTKYAMILDNSGAPVWYRQGTVARNFQIQDNGIITWRGFYGYDQNFNFLRTFDAVNGYNTDNHELQVLEDGGYLLLGLRSMTVDMRRFVPNGRSAAKVSETVLQEFTAEGDLIFQWRAWDNYDIRLMEYWSYDDKPTSGSIRFTHMNSIDVDNDGHLLVSSKRVSEVTKIDRDTGEVIWRLGSGHPVDPNLDPYLDERLEIVGDPLGQFDVQHDIRVVGENRYTVFDNHWLNRSPDSRAVEYEVDPAAGTATFVWQYQEEPPHESHHMGNAQRLANGNTLINWVEKDLPKATEVRPDGTKVFEMNWAAKDSKSYRVFRFPWEGVVEAPYLIVEPYSDNITLIFNKFGDGDVDHYRIYGATSRGATELLDTSSTTLKRLSDLENGRRYYFRVTAVDSQGTESAYSNEVSVDVRFVESGRNMVLNGGFFLPRTWWTWEVQGSAAAEWTTQAGVGRFDITGGGTQFTDVQLRQEGMQLIKGKEYVLEFDAWCDQPRYIEPVVGRGGSDYSRIGPCQITPVRRRYRYPFVMQEESDYEASVVFNLGLYGVGVYLDNVSLRMNTGDDAGRVSIALVSHCAAPGVNPSADHEDDELVAWLEGMGFAVDTLCMNDSCTDGKKPFANAAIVSALENADLVLVSRRTNSSDYDEYGSYWNSLDTPLVLCSGYLTRSTRWKWTACESSDANPSSSTEMTIEGGREDHPFLAGVAGPVGLFDWSGAPTPGVWPGTVFLPNCDFVGGTVIGRYGDTTQRPMLADIPSGGMLANGDITGERRVFFGHWSYAAQLGSPFDRRANWGDFVTSDYKMILRNIINDVLGLTCGDFDFDGCVEYDDLAALAGWWGGPQVSLQGDLDGDGSVDFADFAIFAENWVKQCQ